MKRQKNIFLIIISTIFIIFFVYNNLESAIISPLNYMTNEHFQQDSIKSAESTITPIWTPNGTIICATHESQGDPCIVSDEEGGAIIAWTDERNSGTPEPDIYVQRINSAGVVQWTANGIAVCTATDYQTGSRIVDDGSGGAIIAWGDRRSGISYDIYVQRVNSTGDIQWIANGTAICTATGDQGAPKIVSNEEGGAIIVWDDERNGLSDIYVQRVNSTGDAQWIANGTAVCNANNYQGDIEIVSDGNGGAFITWNDKRNVSSNYDIYAQNLNSIGDAQWTVNGIPICTAINSQGNPSIVSNGEEGVIITWNDNRDSETTDYDIYAQRVAPNTIPTSNHPGTITTSKTGTETIDWALYDDFGGGQYRVWANDTSGNFYVWQDWYTWTNNTLLNVPINRTTPGIFNYTIEYYDAYNLFGVSDTVIVSITNAIPNSNHPGTVTPSKTGTETIDWALYDDFGGGQYRVWVNDTSGNFYVWQDWQSWISGIPLNVSINFSASGIFNYTIEYYDAYNLFGVSDTVIVLITNAIPNSNHPGTITTSKTGTETIGWALYDDFGGGQYRVWANDTSGNFYMWQDWYTWTNNTLLNVPINRTTPGIFNYTIEYYDAYNLFGVSDTVIVIIITEPPGDNEIIPFGNYYVIFMVFGVLSLSIIIKRKILSSNK